MKFSVLISIYYKEKAVDFNNCLESVYTKQLLKPTEIILVADGVLTEELYQVINNWKTKLGEILQVIQLPENIGTGLAKNIGLSKCTYEIVSIVDTDDISVPERFKLQIEFLEKNPEISIIGGQIIEFMDEIENPTGIREVPLSNNALQKYAKKQSPFNNMTITYRKADILKVGGYQHHLWMEDYNLFLRVIAEGYKIQNLPDVLVYARIANGMHGRRKGLGYIKSEKQLLNLKKQLKLQNPIHANILFLIRSAFRLMPSSLLGKIYNTFLRKKVKK